jgi:hypothetical protein
LTVRRVSGLPDSPAHPQQQRPDQAEGGPRSSGW